MSAVTSASLCWTLLPVCLLLVSAEQKNITAECGQNVTLTCRAPNNNTITGVEWSRADLEPEYLLVYRDGQFVPDNQHPSFKNRVDLQDRRMKDGDVSVILKDVTVNDAGTYECRVVQRGTNRWKRANLKTAPISIITLRVVAPPPDQKNITAETGETVTLTCRAPNSKSTDVVNWSRADLGEEYVLLYRDGHFDTDNQHPSFKNRVDLQDRQMKDGDVSVILKNVMINDTGTYECRIFMSGTNEFVSIIYLRVVDPPPEQKNITAESGQNVTLTCRAPNNKNGNITVVKWSRADLKPQYVLLYRNGHFDSEHQHPSFKNRVDLQDRQMKDGDVSVILKNVTINDTGTYECHVVQRGTNNDPSIIYLRVVAPPPDQKNITAESGQNVTLTCRAPNHSIDIVEWSRADLKSQHVFVCWDGQVLPEEQHPSFKNRVDLQDRQMKDGDVSVSLKNVTFNDAGTYECRVQSEDDSVELISIIYLRVVVPPGSGGGTTEDGGKEEGGKEDRGSVGLIVGLSVAAVFLVAAAVFVIYRKQDKKSQTVV
ncbi:butyrophilin-like protein 2 [Archocentrus centrarchus]|uniref:butyrophilin-like protein 2 n=1 Tax=Archocentrus centrarchus TaxID=63155 RepID=UPI0011E9D14F|nr:butyrophilin-like protein 2 [Archocentrus centrarchus]